eukprot:443536-Rhodomonas_salina.2
MVRMASTKSWIPDALGQHEAYFPMDFYASERVQDLESRIQGLGFGGLASFFRMCGMEGGMHEN